MMHGLESLVGTTFAEIEAADEITASAVRHTLEAWDWDPPDSTSVPLSSYLTFALPPYRGVGERLAPGVLPPFPYHEVPLPGSRRMGVSVQVSAGDAPMRIGDRITSSWSVAAVHPRRTRLGDGVFIDYETRFRNQRGGLVAVERATLLGFDPAEDAGRTIAGAEGSSGALAPEGPAFFAETDGPVFDPAAPVVGAVLRPLRLDMGVQRHAMIHAANRDFAPIHHDPAAAAEIGASTLVMNTMSMLTAMEILFAQNGGDRADARRLGPVRLSRPTEIGQTFIASGVVSGVSRGAAGRTVTADVRLGGSRSGVTATGSGEFLIHGPK